MQGSRRMRAQKQLPPLAVMELGLGFENEDYEVQKKDRKVPLQSYNAKVCNPLWFDDGSSLGDQDWEHVSNVLRLQADHAYSLGDFENAYLKYNEALGLSSNSSAMQRHFSESKTRCLLHLGRPQECRQAAQLLVLESNNCDQERQAQLLLASACLAQKDFPAAETVLHSLIASEPEYAHFWLQLANIYQGLQHVESSTQPMAAASTGVGPFPSSLEREHNCSDAPSNLGKNCLTNMETGDFHHALSEHRLCVNGPRCSPTSTGKSKMSQTCSDRGPLETKPCGGEQLSGQAASSVQTPVECMEGSGGDSATWQTPVECMEGGSGGSAAWQTPVECMEGGSGGSAAWQNSVQTPVMEGSGGDSAAWQNSVCDLMKTQCSVAGSSEVDARYQDAGMEDAGSLRLMELACLVRARMLLQTVEGSVGGLVRSRNLTLIAKIQRRLDGMAFPSSVIEGALQVMGREARAEEGRSREHPDTPAVLSQDKTDKSTDFRTTWFSWIHSLGNLRQ